MSTQLGRVNKLNFLVNALYLPPTCYCTRRVFIHKPAQRLQTCTVVKYKAPQTDKRYHTQQTVRCFLFKCTY